MTHKRQYSDEEVKEDVKSFFLDISHWAYQYGDPTPLCNPDSPYHRKQIELLFESKYQHWATDRAVSALIKEGFLLEKPFPLPGLELKFVHRYNRRYIARQIKERANVVRAYSDPNISKGTGDQAEIQCLHLFKSNSFNILDRNTKEYNGTVWTKTGHDLDFIVEKDGIVYGVEVKNWFPYIEDDLYDIKLDICSHLGIRPLFFLRMASYSQIEKANNQGGIMLIFKSKIFPPGNEQLVRDIWNRMRLPVSIWQDIPVGVTRNLLSLHKKIIDKQPVCLNTTYVIQLRNSLAYVQRNINSHYKTISQQAILNSEANQTIIIFPMRIMLKRHIDISCRTTPMRSIFWRSMTELELTNSSSLLPYLEAN